MDHERLLLSASQITLFTECQRKWAFRYIENIRPPPHPSAVLGTEVHEKQLGPYLTAGQAFDFSRPSGEIANALVPLLPKPRTEGLQIERKFEIPSPSGRFWYQGFIDLYAPDSRCVPGLAVDLAPLVGDFKTTSNLAYAKTSEVLATDIQAQLYAMSTMFEEDVDVLDLVWFYTRTRKPPRAQRTHLRVFAPHVAEQFKRIDEIGQRVVTIKGSGLTKASELPPNARSCEMYGGCPHRSICNLAPPVFAEGVNQEAMEAKTNNFLNMLRGQVAPAAAPPVGQPAAPEPEKLPDWATAPVDPRVAKQKINPPESELPPAPPVGAAAALANLKAGVGRLDFDANDTAPTIGAPAVAEPAKKRGRPAKVTPIPDVIPTLPAALQLPGFPVDEFKALLRKWLENLEAA